MPRRMLATIIDTPPSVPTDSIMEDNMPRRMLATIIDTPPSVPTDSILHGNMPRRMSATIVDTPPSVPTDSMMDDSMPRGSTAILVSPTSTPVLDDVGDNIAKHSKTAPSSDDAPSIDAKEILTFTLKNALVTVQSDHLPTLEECLNFFVANKKDLYDDDNENTHDWKRHWDSLTSTPIASPLSLFDVSCTPNAKRSKLPTIGCVLNDSDDKECNSTSTCDCRVYDAKKNSNNNEDPTSKN
jgi:hypothetical protein